ncbi:unnamed protein product [Microthlaspi erraticum]|uniref:Uncharacterized protein n=1 Tax=Microthlaspi erraticum TaxID=1685480 RepID=A0A6D2HYK8_9BRAS|nr:unnamed protein product [Microthlaspi erraticum]
MKLKTLFLPIFCSFLITLDSVSAQNCYNGFLKPNSTYDLNRRRVLSSLASDVTSHNGFFNSSIGQDPDRVFVIAMCIPGAEPENCSDCIRSTSDGLLRGCPNGTGAYAWPDVCMVRYSNIPFSGSLLMEPSATIPFHKDIVDTYANMTVIDRVYEELMIRTIAAASSPSSSFGQKNFAAEVASLTRFQNMYAMMQCTPDVSSGSCEFCLRRCVGDYLSCCRGKRGGAVVRPSCFFRWDLYPFVGAFDNVTLPPPPLPPQPPVSDRANKTGKDGKSISKGTVVAIVVPTVVVLALLVVGFRVFRRKKSYKTIEIQAGDEITITRSRQFSFMTIEAATDKFSDSNMIGRGGFGVVYKGRLLCGTEVAVKRLSKTSEQGAEEFKNEAVLVTKLQHRNLVRVLGFCLEGEEKILVYEFVPNKSLDYFLFDPAKQGELDWTRRYNIMGGIARGLLYLHQDSRLTIIHRDLKASNILLDVDMKPKIADFGMARIFGVDQSQANTRRIVGTYFGVLVLEIISGKMNSSFYQTNGSAGNLVTHAWRLWRKGSALELLDPTFGENYQTDEATRCIHIALLCVQEDPEDRPTMSTIILLLTSSTITLQVPRAPGFFFQSSRDQDLEASGSHSFGKPVPCSIDDGSITKLHPRGYMSPEYAMRGHFSMKSDVYSFGVMILEIISGKKNSSFFNMDDSSSKLVTHAWRLWRNGSRLELVDPTIGESYQNSEANRLHACIHIALLCVQQNPVDRPLLPAIILMLTSSSTTTLHVPRAPGFYFQSRRDELDPDGLSSTQSTSRSIPGDLVPR